jgi:hypothetical protein
MDDTPDITEQEAAEKAFVQSELHEFNGFALKPWSPARAMAAQAMGLRYGSIDAAGISRFQSDKMYPGGQRDMAIVLWLCTLKTHEEIDAAARAPVLAMKSVYQFAADHGLTDDGTESHWKGFTMFLGIMNEIAASRVKAEKKTSPENEQTTSLTT